eukprot:CAMPEP_0179891888 /NCGR_PEP_ID=MMETSP0982-20121206/33923_1 /TAXON_ID=483367 /ORGANISM="non described non described, Strain CCMP 2436" /LENGTH=130 /DNA_ID=CAMNT_0021788303 /DNA_START=729 /DNA_END=1121 /DNA_ORIENTATION=-
MTTRAGARTAAPAEEYNAPVCKGMVHLQHRCVSVERRLPESLQRVRKPDCVGVDLQDREATVDDESLQQPLSADKYELMKTDVGHSSTWDPTRPRATGADGRCGSEGYFVIPADVRRHGMEERGRGAEGM